MEKLVKKGDILQRDKKLYRVIIADDELFITCPIQKIAGGYKTNCMRAEVYSNRSSVLTLKDMRFEVVG